MHPEEGPQLAFELLLTAQEPIHVNWQPLSLQSVDESYLQASLQELSEHTLEQLEVMHELVQPPPQLLQELYVDAQK